MATCYDCIHSSVCTPYNTPNDDYPNIGDCPHFKDKANLVEVKYGEWKQNKHCKRIYYCSECGRHIEDGSNKPTEFFPYCHCGAKMKGGAE